MMSTASATWHLQAIVFKVWPACQFYIVPVSTLEPNQLWCPDIDVDTPPTLSGLSRHNDSLLGV